MWKSPSWWWEQRPVSVGWRLLARVYQTAAQGYSFFSPGAKKSIYPVISIGNTVMGGAGKTPVTQLIGRLLTHMGFQPLIITRGYKGRVKGPVAVDLSIHGPKDVGEEAFVMAHSFPTWVARRRCEALPLLPSCGNGVVVLDDGHQHTSLVKDISFLVFNHHQKWGNGHVFPAGPLRETMTSSLSRAQGVFYICPDKSECPSFPRPVFPLRASFTCDLSRDIPVVGFAGIGYPQRFEHTLTEMFSCVKAFAPFQDHISYTQNHEQYLLDLAASQGARLVTTQKDWVKLSPSVKSKVSVVHQQLKCDNEEGLTEYFRSKLALS